MMANNRESWPVYVIERNELTAANKQHGEAMRSWQDFASSTSHPCKNWVSAMKCSPHSDSRMPSRRKKHQCRNYTTTKVKRRDLYLLVASTLYANQLVCMTSMVGSNLVFLN